MSITKSIIQIVARGCSFVVSPGVAARLSQMNLAFHSTWIRRAFAECGKNCTIGRFSALVGGKYIHLADNLYIGKNVVWEVYDKYGNQTFTPRMTMGDGSSFGDNGHITCINEVCIGKGVRIGRRVFITDNSHGTSQREQMDIPANKRPMMSKGPVILEDNVWIGEGSFIMPGVTIGKGTIIGAGSVVTKSIPQYCVAAGNPARVIKEM